MECVLFFVEISAVSIVDASMNDRNDFLPEMNY